MGGDRLCGFDRFAMWARTTGNLNPAPIKATVTLDPLVLHTGVTYRF